MNVKDHNKAMQKLPQDMAVRYAVDEGRGRRSIGAINQIENHQINL